MSDFPPTLIPRSKATYRIWDYPRAVKRYHVTA
jgi:hypothetical protein